MSSKGPTHCRGKAKNPNAGPTESRSLTEEEERKAREIFAVYDYDGSGTIEITELRDLLLELQLSLSPEFLEEFVQSVFQHLDKDRTLRLDFGEFVTLYQQVISQQPPGVAKRNQGRRIDVKDLKETELALRDIFNVYDVDQSGYLDMQEMIQVLEEAGLPDPHGDGFQTVIDSHMAFADADMDGRIDFQEFLCYTNAVIDYIYDVGKGDAAKTASAY